MTSDLRSQPSVRILVIEDTPELLELIGLLLSSAGYAVLAAGTGEEGLSLAAREAPDLVLLDLELPDMDGLSVLHRLRTDPKFAHQPVVALTATTMKGERERLLAAGFTHYLPKPVRPRQLLQQIASFLNMGLRAPPST